MSIKIQFEGFRNSISEYFRNYGGWSELLSSPLLWIALAISTVSYRNWLEPNWLEVSQELIPSLLGFSLGTYAILVSLLTGRLKRALREVKNGRGVSYLADINSNFFHFIFVQVSALAWGFLFDGSWAYDAATFLKIYYSRSMDVFEAVRTIGSFFGHFLLVYSFLLILAAALQVYRLVLINDLGGD
ncbi:MULTISPECIES: hypothetical protein [Sinorhizobium]|uniref:hypothetical protein n=1 Tax=Sinorhizobium TaxID=28105 RepID=UPI000364A496|nr:MULTISPECIES: hypothetical protein [Sinorhizobium]MDE4602475.1 hypothetical protein [Sinorhizobium meliloti]